MSQSGHRADVNCSLSVPDLTCAVCGLRIQAFYRDGEGFSFTHAHGGCDEWRNRSTRCKCIGRVQLTTGLMLRFWPPGETEMQSVMGYGSKGGR